MNRNLAWLVLLCGACAARQPLRVSAAISLKPWLTPALQAFEQAPGGAKVEANYGASGILERQIEAGAPADLFLSASPTEVDRLAVKIPPAARATLARNRLVLAFSRDAPPFNDLHDLTSPAFHAVAVGRPTTVPAGRYAQQLLEPLGLWKPLLTKLVFANDVAEVRTWVQRGEVEAGFVYQSEAEGLPKVVELPGAPPVELVVALLPGASSKARALFDYLTSPDRAPSLRAAGLLPP